MKLYVVHAFASWPHWKPKYLPDQFADHVKASAYRVVRNGINVTPENAPVVEVDELPWPSSNDNPDADTNEDTLPSEALTSNTDCTSRWYWKSWTDQTFRKEDLYHEYFHVHWSWQMHSVHSSVFERFWITVDGRRAPGWPLSKTVWRVVSRWSHPSGLREWNVRESYFTDMLLCIGCGGQPYRESMVATCTSTEILEEPIGEMKMSFSRQERPWKERNVFM
jgi:hypothetical protein